ncbi:MAG: DHH family phosphoesterase [Candidatus Anstonellales archaeon]
MSVNTTIGILVKSHNAITLISPFEDFNNYEIILQNNEKLLLNQFSIVNYSIEREKNILIVENIEKLNKEKIAIYITNLEEKISPLNLLIKINKEYEPTLTLSIKNFATDFFKLLLQNPKIIMRYNRDADGISSALAFARPNLPFLFISHNSPIYDIDQATKDIINLKTSEKKVVILLDFGSNEESLDALMCLHENNVKTVIIDHHPMYEENKKYANILNSYDFSKNSEITTGFLCANISRYLNLIDEKFAQDLCFVSFAGDKSPFLNLTEKKEIYEKIAECIDFQITYNQLNSYEILSTAEKIIIDESFLNEVDINRQEMKEKMKEKILKYQKVKFNQKKGLYVIYLNLNKFEEFKSKSKLCNLALELSNESNKPCAIIAYSKEKIIFRINNAALNLGVSSEEIIEKLKKNELLISGGGHKVAASITFEKDNYSLIMKEIENYFEN